MKTPFPRGFAATSPTAAICDHVASFYFRGKRAARELPEPPDLASLYDLPRANPYVRMPATRAAIAASGTWSVDRPEPRKIPMPFSPPRFRRKKDGTAKEVKWLLVIESVIVTVTLPLGSFTLTASASGARKGSSVLDSRDGSRKLLPFLRADLRRILGKTAAAAALAELATLLD